jgi:hypothetical protein
MNNDSYSPSLKQKLEERLTLFVLRTQLNIFYNSFTDAEFNLLKKIYTDQCHTVLNKRTTFKLEYFDSDVYPSLGLLGLFYHDGKIAINGFEKFFEVTFKIKFFIKFTGEIDFSILKKYYAQICYYYNEYRTEYIKGNLPFIKIENLMEDIHKRAEDAVLNNSSVKFTHEEKDILLMSTSYVDDDFLLDNKEFMSILLEVMHNIIFKNKEHILTEAEFNDFLFICFRISPILGSFKNSELDDNNNIKYVERNIKLVNKFLE